MHRVVGIVGHMSRSIKQLDLSELISFHTKIVPPELLHVEKRRWYS
jgi:hypothetical protein